MRVTPEMPIAAALALDQQIIAALVWLTPDFEQLRDAAVRSVVAERTTVAQAARMAHVPLNAALYALNLMAGEDELLLAREIMERGREDFEFNAPDSSDRPSELARPVGLRPSRPLRRRGPGRMPLLRPGRSARRGRQIPSRRRSAAHPHAL
jgi:hypothetical protein